MKTVISTFAAAIVLFLISFVFYSIMESASKMQSYIPLLRGHDDFKLWAMIAGCLLEGLFLTVIYSYYYKGEAPLKEGFIYGLLMAFLMALPFVFFMWGAFKVQYKGVIADGIGMGFRIFVTCIVIGLIMGKKENK